jgi:hypothetical protein
MMNPKAITLNIHIDSFNHEVDGVVSDDCDSECVRSADA